LTHRGKALLALAVACLASLASASGALAAPPTVTIDPNPTGFYNTARVSGTIDPGEKDTYFTFQTSTDGVNWSSFNYEGFVAGETGLQNIPPREIGVSPGTKYFVRLAAIDNFNAFEGSEIFSPGPNPTFETKPVPPPVVTFAQPSAVTGTSAHFSGTIDPEAPPGNPQAFEVIWYIECTPECPDMPFIYLPADSDVHPIEVDAKDLLPGTSYQVRFITQNSGGTYTQTRNFTTQVLAPAVKTSQAHVTTTTASLSGSINPNGAETAYHFEWGPGFANSTPTKTLFAGTAPVAVTANLSGLTPDTTYPFRLVATNSAGEVKSADKAFTTQAEVKEECPNDAFRVGPSAALPDCRAYELVNPPGTDWSDIVRVWPASDDGNHISYLTLVPPEIANSAIVASSFVSSRTDSGWTTKDVNLRVRYVYGLDVSLPSCFSSDYSHAIIDTPATINDQDQDGGGHDLALIEAGNPFGEPLTFGEELPDKQRAFPLSYLGGAPDLSHILFYASGAQLLSAAPGGIGIYMRDASGLHVVSRDTEGKVLNEVVPVGPFNAFGASNCPTRQNSSRNIASTDGTKLFYTTNFFSGPIYRNDLTAGKVISVTRSHRAGDASNMGSGVFQFATPDGDVVYFTSGEQLTDDATPGGGIYRYEVSTDTLEQISPEFNHPFGFEGSAYGSDADSALYFNSQRRLTPDAPRGMTNIYVWERGDEGGTPGPGGPGKGTTRLITSLTDGGIVRVSQNGRYMLIQSRNSIDGAPNKGKSAIYLYDAETRDFACVSCRPNGTSSARDSNLADEPESLTTGIINPRNISNDGRVFFNSSDRLIPADQTFSQDVYEFYRGRVYLISSGQGDENQSYLADSSDDGRHVFFLSRTAFRPEDRDSAELDIYDAHIGGGFPLPKPVPPICEGEACRTATSPKPEDVAPTTPSFSGAPNPRVKREKQKRRHHKKGHHKKKHHKKKHHSESKGGKGKSR
jgi:hypothetical protein